MPPGKTAAIVLVILWLSGCGFTVAPADLFELHRYGPGPELTLVVSDGGTVRCDSAGATPIPDSMLIAARDLAVDLGKDAKAHLRLSARRGSVFTYSVKLQDGTVRFADTSGAAHPELARAELFAAQTAAGPCARH